jgi:hypothetical protein
MKGLCGNNGSMARARTLAFGSGNASSILQPRIMIHASHTMTTYVDADALQT